MIGDPDPYTAIMNALQFFRVDDIVISTFAETKSGWLRADLIERVRNASGKDVEHVVAQPNPLGPPPSTGGARWKPPRSPQATPSTTGRRRPTAPRAWTPRRWGCCCSSSPR